MANSHLHCMKLGLKALHGSQFPASNETVSLFASTYPTSSCKRNFPSLETKTRIVSRCFETHDLHSTLIVDGFQNPMHIICVFRKSNCVKKNVFSKTASTHAHLYAGLRHHSFHKSLVGGIVGAKTNSHDLLARSSTWHQHQVKLRSHSLTERTEHPNHPRYPDAPYRENLPTLPLESGYSSPNVLM